MREALKRLGKTPLLDLGMRLGEGSGAALAVAIVKAAVACHNGMATFAEAGVAGKRRAWNSGLSRAFQSNFICRWRIARDANLVMPEG